MNSKRPALLLLLLVVAVLGCSQGDGLKRYRLSGNVTYKGKPVPAGEIQFTPNSREGNSGPGMIVPIKDGHYETAPGKGHLGGAYGVQIVGYDGKANSESDLGVSLFQPYAKATTLPREDSTLDFDVSSK
ncbi:hypothetical protein GC197_17505 [bacterium]|nr:hypothetical protein [bacterium]